MDDESKEYILICTVVFLILGLAFLLSAYWREPAVAIEMRKQGYKLDYVTVVLLPNWNGTFTVEVENVGGASTKLDYSVEPVNVDGLNVSWNSSDVKLKPNNTVNVMFWLITSKELNVNEIYVKVLPSS